MRRIRRAGLSRVEVLVVVAGSAVVLALLVVGLQHARETAQTTKCQNYLRQIGLAVANYESAKRRFPPATQPPADLPPDQRLGWLMAILPLLESTDLYRRSGPWDSEVNRSAAVHMLVYTCPAAPDATTTLSTSYLGVTGVGPDSATLPVDHPRAGVFGYDRPTTWRDVTDGQSSTLLAVEGSGGPWLRGGSATLRAADPTARPYLGPDRPFGGRHGAMHNLLTADGAVRGVRETLSPEVLEALATIAGKEELPADW